MKEGYVLVQTLPGTAATVAAAAGRLPGVREVEVVQGAYDIVLSVRPDSGLAAGLLPELRALAGVLRALPLKLRPCLDEVAGAA